MMLSKEHNVFKSPQEAMFKVAVSIRWLLQPLPQVQKGRNDFGQSGLLVTL